MTPEEQARERIDEWLVSAGWQVVDRSDYAASSNAVAVREALLRGNQEADYLLHLDGRAVGVLEAKREEVDVGGDAVSEQVEGYARSLPANYPAFGNPLPLLFKSNGKVLLFRDLRYPQSTYEARERMLTPKEMAQLLELGNRFAGLPHLRPEGLRSCQHEAVSALEESLRQGRKRALIVLATGAGKTYTACLVAYRLLSFTDMRRVLFLVDRNNLGRQAENEFRRFRRTASGQAFTDIFPVQRLAGRDNVDNCNVLIATIQRLYAYLKGEDVGADDDDHDLAAEDAAVSVAGELKLPGDFFDLIIIDESHRSIYGNWRRVLDYFRGAHLIGLTATPEPKTVAFFDENVVAQYSLEQSIVDGVNVPARIYRIATEATTNGGAIRKGDKLRVTTRYTGQVDDVRCQANRAYSPQELNRSVVNPAQIKLVLQTYRDVVYTQLFCDPPREPDLARLPKTLIFALNEAHANNIVRIAREVFEQPGEHFAQKITHTAGNSDELIRQFRNDRDFRIAVTCTLVATGTDIKPLEVLLFMRDVDSDTLYTQMKGRGVRTIADDVLRSVTTNATSKECFYLVDAVGVTEHPHRVGGLDLQPAEQPVTLKALLEQITHGHLPDEHLRRLSGTLARLLNRADQKQRDKFARLAHADMRDLAQRIVDALNADTLPPYTDVNAPNQERKALVAPLANHPQAREQLLIMAAGVVTQLNPGEDKLNYSGFSKDEAASATEQFERYCRDHRDELMALRIIYNNEGEPITYAMLQELQQRLIEASPRFEQERLWHYYATIHSDDKKVTKNHKKEEREALTNLIQLVRFAYGQTERLKSLVGVAQSRFELWCGQKQAEITPEQRGVMAKVLNHVASNASYCVKEIRGFDETLAAQVVSEFGDKEAANQAILSLYNFVIKKAA